MARIRTIKPDSLQHRKVGRLSDRAFRLWVCCLTQADDEGRLICDVGQLCLLAFGYQKTTQDQVETALNEIINLGLLRKYQVGNDIYLDFPSWHNHQVINRPQVSNIPEYNPIHGTFTEHSLNAHGTFTGEGRKEGKEGKDIYVGQSEKVERNFKDEAKQILSFLNEKTGKNYQSVEANLSFIEGRLKSGVSLQDCKSIIALKRRQWQGSEMEQYLRPATLFNRTKFAQYQGELLKEPTNEGLS